ncbi:hypothetical protein PMAYCL1PPCAC_18072, partial [Pristionchus mayeri]
LHSLHVLQSSVNSDASSIMEELSRILVGKYATPRDKINLMGEMVIASLGQQREKSDEEIRDEVMTRFERLGLKNRVDTVSYLESEITSEGLKSTVYFLFRLSLSLEDSAILKQSPLTPTPSFFSLTRSDRNGGQTLIGGKRDEKTVTISPDDGCAESGRDASHSIRTRLPSGHLTKEYLSIIKGRTRANPMQKECVEVSMGALSSSFSHAISGISTFIFRIGNGSVSAVSPLFISNQSINLSRIFITHTINFIHELMKAEESVVNCIGDSTGDLPSRLCQVVIQYLNDIREEANCLLNSRPFPCRMTIRKNIENILEKGDYFISLSRLVMELRNASCVECLDSLVACLSSKCIDEELAIPVLHLLSFALDKTLEDAESFMLTGEVSQLGLILETTSGSTIAEEYRGGRIEGDRWRKNYGIVVAHGKSIDRTTADEIMAEGKLALMRLRDPSLVEEYSRVSWDEVKGERKEERKKVAGSIGRGITIGDVRQIIRDSIKWVRTCGDRSIFLSKQINLVTNSLEVVWQVFLLGDRVTRVPHIDGSTVKRYQQMRDAIAAFPDQHLLAVSYNSNKRSSFITLQVSGALSIIVSSSNISIYTEAHKLLSKLFQVYHQISQAYLCLPPLRKGCDHILRGLHKALAEITHWVGKLCGHFCSQVHEVVWKQTSKEVLRSLPSFDLIFAVHRKALKQLAGTLFLQTSLSSLSAALHSSIDAASEFARNLECEEWEKAAEKYTDFLEAAQMFTHGLIVDEDPLKLRSTLLQLIDPREKFRM